MSDDKQLECFKVCPVGILGQNNAPVQRVLSDGASKSRLMPRVPRVGHVMSASLETDFLGDGGAGLLDTTGRMFPLVPGIFRRTPDTMDVACS